METFLPSSGHSEGRIWTSQTFLAPSGLLLPEPTKAHPSRVLLSQGTVVPWPVGHGCWHTCLVQMLAPLLTGAVPQFSHL